MNVTNCDGRREERTKFQQQQDKCTPFN